MKVSYDEIYDCLAPLAEAGGKLYEVGGPVRDRLMQRPVKDRDVLCTGLAMSRISALLKPYGKVAGVGKSFGIIKFSPHRRPGLTIDLALPRRERSTGSGHRDFDVDFDPELPVEQDLGRRDFTVNAMARSLDDGRIIDPYGGTKDIRDRVLRMVFPRAFEEDPLRLVRGIQFAARLGFRIEDDTREAMKRSAALIKTVSGERIGMELVKLMSAEKPSRGFDLMRDSGLMKQILPELLAIGGIEQDKQPGDDVYGHTMRALDAARSDSALEGAGDLDLMFAVLLHDIGKAHTARFHEPAGRVVFFGHQLASKRKARRIAERLKLQAAGIDTSRMLKLIENHMFETKASYTDRAIRRFVQKVGKDLIFTLIDLRIADNRGGKHPAGIKGVLRLRKRIRDELAKKPPFGPGDLAIDGTDVMELGPGEGPIVGTILSALVERVLDDPELNTKDELLALAKEMMENPAIRELSVQRAGRTRSAGFKGEGPDVQKTESGQGS